MKYNGNIFNNNNSHNKERLGRDGNHRKYNTGQKDF